ncbi:hypothetical protein [Streptomyces monomycini]|uniref:hypothetical protein n=1 Tax=Streptomyces monomycini TaxID=371720 RepID=UPI0004AB9C80|nr:hypothetical protein [Streptomyces monomycini]
MDWGTLAGTALGALLGVSTTLLGERSRWHRENTSRERAAKQQLYSEYLAALWLTRHRLRDLQRSTELTWEERREQSGEILGAANAFQLLYQMRIMAPESLDDVAVHAFRRLLRLRDRFDEPDVNRDPGWSTTQAALSEALEALRQPCARTSALCRSTGLHTTARPLLAFSGEERPGRPVPLSGAHSCASASTGFGIRKDASRATAMMTTPAIIPAV